MENRNIVRIDFRSVNGLIEDSMIDEIGIDFTDLKRIDSDGLVCLVLFLKRKSKESEITIVLPEIKPQNCPLTYLVRCGFFEKIGHNINYSAEDQLKINMLRNKTYRILNYATSLIDNGDGYDLWGQHTTLSTVVKVIVEYIERLYKGDSDGRFIFGVESIMSEVLLNLINHAGMGMEQKPYFCAQIQTFAPSKWRPKSGFRIGIGDLGIGIMNSLNTAKDHDYKDGVAALSDVIFKGVSRLKQEDEVRGGGLRRASELSGKLNFGFRLRSGGAEVFRGIGGKLQPPRICTYFPGTQLFLWQ